MGDCGIDFDVGNNMARNWLAYSCELALLPCGLIDGTAVKPEGLPEIDAYEWFSRMLHESGCDVGALQTRLASDSRSIAEES